MDIAKQLASGVDAMGLCVTEQQQNQLIEYLLMLEKWNKVYNLTAVRNLTDMVTLHLLDSMSILSHITATKLLDVGSGGGLPGIVLAICRPDLQVTTIDKVQKKAIFMRQVKGELALKNLHVVQGRVEDFQPEEQFDGIVSRAFSEIANFIDLTKHLLVEGGYWYAMKGVVPTLTLGNLGLGEPVIHRLEVSGLDAERHLVTIQKV